MTTFDEKALEIADELSMCLMNNRSNDLLCNFALRIRSLVLEELAEQEPVTCNPSEYCACRHQPLYLHPAVPDPRIAELEGNYAICKSSLSQLKHDLLLKNAQIRELQAKLDAAEKG